MVEAVKANKPPVAGGSVGEGAAAAATPRAMPALLIGGWGVGGVSTEASRRRWQDRWLRSAFEWWLGDVVKDFVRGTEIIQEAKRNGVLRPTTLLPPLLTNGPRTDKFLSGTDVEMVDKMHTTDTISRLDLAELALQLTEKAGNGEELPEWVAVRNP